MKKTIILLLSAFILAGCGSKTEVPANGGTESSSQAVSEAEKSEENEVLTIWRKDITLQDAFVPTQELKDLPFKELTTSAAEALPVHIKLHSEEKKSEKIESIEGGVSAQYAVVEMTEDVREKYPRIVCGAK